MDVKSLSIEVRAKGIKAAANALGDLSKQAQAVDPALAAAIPKLEELSNISFGGATGQVRTFRDAVRELRDSTKKVEGGSEFATTVAKLGTALDKVISQKAGIDTYVQQLREIRQQLQGIKDAGVTSLPKIPSGRASSGGGGSVGSTDEEKFAKTQQNLLRSIERQAVVATKGRTAWLEQEAAMKGVSAQAAPFIAQLKAVDKQITNVAGNTRAMNSFMRQVPAQFTDIATQLAGGQNPFLVMLQQGGQLTDSARMVGLSFGQMLRSVGGMAAKYLLNPFVLGAAAVGGFGYAMYKAADEVQAFNKALALTGGINAITTDQFLDMSKALEKTGSTRGAAAEVLTELASTGKIAGESYNTAATAVLNFSRVTGTETKNIVAEFDKIARDPVQALSELNEKYHTVNASTFARVRALAEEGNKAAAVKLATDEHARALDVVTQKYQNSKGYIETFMDSIINGSKKAINALMDLGREQSKTSRREQLLAEIRQAKSSIQGSGAGNLQALENELRLLDIGEKLEAGAKSRQAITKEANDKALVAQKSLYDSRMSYMTKEQKKQEELNLLARQEKDIREGMAPSSAKDKALEEIEARRKMINSRDAGQPNVKRESAILAEIEALKSEIDTLNTLGATFTKVTDARKQYAAAEIALGNKNLSAKDRKELEAQLPALRERAELTERRNFSLEQYNTYSKEGETLKSAYDKIDALRQETEELIQSGNAKGKLTEAEKAAVEWKRKAKEATDLDVISQRMNIAAAFEKIAADEKQMDAQKALNAVKLDAIKLNEKSNAATDALQSKLSSGGNIDPAALRREEEARSVQTLIDLNQRYRAEVAAGHAEAALGIANQISWERQQIALREQLITKYEESRFSMENFFTSASAAWTNYLNTQQTAAQAMQSIFTSAFDKASDAISNFATGAKMNTKDMVKSMLQDIAKLLIKLAILQTMQALTGTGGRSDASSYSSAIAAGFGSGRGMIGSSGADAVTANANGGVFSNNVYKQPSYFKDTRGNMNVLGEAGPEAVVPLAKTSSGQLGIQVAGGGSSGGGGNNIVVNTNITISDAGVSSNTTATREDGKAIADMVNSVVTKRLLEETRQGGMLNRSGK